MKWERKEKKLNLLCIFGKKERSGKEERKVNFSFLCLVCNKKEMKRKKKNIYIYILLLLCPYKCERCIKFMDKYVTS